MHIFLGYQGLLVLYHITFIIYFRLFQIQNSSKLAVPWWTYRQCQQLQSASLSFLSSCPFLEVFLFVSRNLRRLAGIFPPWLNFILCLSLGGAVVVGGIGLVIYLSIHGPYQKRKVDLGFYRFFIFKFIWNKSFLSLIKVSFLQTRLDLITFEKLPWVWENDKNIFAPCVSSSFITRTISYQFKTIEIMLYLIEEMLLTKS